ncbi:MAG: Hsp20/alpha crystallin family protein [Chloroflexi bacterium]|nr:Hsp20/alpha crystallin family protein [Chloroflexota bacterium]
MPEQRRPRPIPRGPHQSRPDDAGIHIDLGFGDLFKGLGNFMDLVGKMAEEGKSEIGETREVQGPSGMRGVYGFSVKMGLGGTPTIEQFGNIRSTDRGPEVSEVREPLADIFDEGDHILVVVELPGVAEADIAVEAKDDIFTVSAKSRDHKYAKELLLPAMVDPASLQRSYQNGILEVRLNKVEGHSAD